MYTMIHCVQLVGKRRKRPSFHEVLFHYDDMVPY